MLSEISRLAPFKLATPCHAHRFHHIPADSRSVLQFSFRLINILPACLGPILSDTSVFRRFLSKGPSCLYQTIYASSSRLAIVSTWFQKHCPVSVFPSGSPHCQPERRLVDACLSGDPRDSLYCLFKICHLLCVDVK